MPTNLDFVRNMSHVFSFAQNKIPFLKDKLQNFFCGGFAKKLLKIEKTTLAT